MQWPNQLSAQLSDQLQRQLPTQLPAQIPGQLTESVPGQVPVQMPGPIAGHFAEDLPDSVDNLYHFEEVSVTANKERLNIRELPLSATAFSASQLKSKNIGSVKEITAFVPNLFMPDYGSRLTSPIYIRGIGSKINAPSVGLYVDQVPYFEKSAFDFDMLEIERIEVLSGSQGTLYGRNTMGGVIRVQSKLPLNYKGSRFTVGAGNYHLLEASAAHYGEISPKVGFSLSGQYKQHGGYFTNLYSGKRTDPVDAGSVKMRWRWKPDNTSDLNLVMSYENSDQGGYPYAQYNKTEQESSPVNYNDPSSYQREMSTNGLTWQKKAGSLTLHARTGFQFLSDRQAVDQDFSTRNAYFVTQNQQQNMWSQEIELQSDPDPKKRMRWHLGLFGFVQSLKNRVQMQYKEDALAANNLTHPLQTLKQYDTPTSGVALYHQSSLTPFGEVPLALTFGLRYDYEQARTHYTYYRTTQGLTTEADQFRNRLSFHQFSPKLSLQYTFRKRNRVYLSATKGYKTGGFNTSFERPEDRSFDPEYSYTYEAGAKFITPKGNWSGEVALFYIDWRHQQIYQPLPSGKGSMLKNAGKSASKGVEVSLRGQITPHLRIETAYGYTHATFREHKPSAEADYSGNYLPFVPANTYSGGLIYSRNVNTPLFNKMTLSGFYNGTGKIWWNEKNDASQKFYGLINATLRFDKGKVGYEVWMRNIGSTSYHAFYFNSMGKSFVQKGLPFLGGLRITLQI